MKPPSTASHPLFTTVLRSTFQSCGWIVLWAGIAIFCLLLAKMVYTDFMHVNPDRTSTHALMLPFLFSPLMLLMMFPVWLSILPAMLLQAVSGYLALRLGGIRNLPFAMLATPLMALIALFLFRELYFDFNFGFNETGAEKPSIATLTTTTFLASLAVNAVISAMMLLRLYAELTGHKTTKRRVMYGLTALLAVVVLVMGYGR